MRNSNERIPLFREIMETEFLKDLDLDRSAHSDAGPALYLILGCGMPTE